MQKVAHEIRDPIHVFIKYDSYEREVLNSKPFQRLRHIHQLGLTYLLYPGATHRRFEHSLGVMELSSHVYDIVTNGKNIHTEVKEVLPQTDDAKQYWRRVIRMAGLCHDLGHLPFSHTAEKELLPEGWNHERLTVELIKSKEMCSIWDNMEPPLKPDAIAKLAVGPKVFKEVEFTDWETLLSEIIVGDSFGVDRIDYLLRDSHHTGVMYGKFDHYRLIETLRILPKSEESNEPTLGIESGGIHTAEALQLARYFMFIQVYLHPVRRIYDIHLKDFLLNWLKEGKFSVDLNSFLELTDNEVTTEYLSATRNPDSKAHDPAKRIVFRNHFKVLYVRNPIDYKIHPEPGRVIYDAASKKYGKDFVCHDQHLKEGGVADVPVLSNDDRIVSSLNLSKVLNDIPHVGIDFVFIDPQKRDEARKWLKENRERILKEAKEKGEQ